jgi:hypothetical protein
MAERLEKSTELKVALKMTCTLISSSSEYQLKDDGGGGRNILTTIHTMTNS